MSNILEIKNKLSSQDLGTLTVNKETGFFLKIVFDEFYCFNKDQSIIIHTFKDVEPDSSELCQVFHLYLNDILVLEYIGENSSVLNIHEVLYHNPFLNLSSDYFDFLIKEIDEKGKGCIVYFGRMSEKVLDYVNDININIQYIRLKDKKYKNKSFFKIVNGDIFISYGLYSNQYYGEERYHKHFNKIKYLKTYYKLYSFIIYQSLKTKDIRLFISNYDFEILINNSKSNPYFFNEPRHFVPYNTENIKRTISIKLLDSDPVIDQLIDESINTVLKHYPCKEFIEFLSSAGLMLSSFEPLTDDEQSDYVNLFRIDTFK